jgi:hypothetical protein
MKNVSNKKTSKSKTANPKATPDRKGKKVEKLSKKDLKNLKGGRMIPARCCEYL